MQYDFNTLTTLLLDQPMTEKNHKISHRWQNSDNRLNNRVSTNTARQFSTRFPQEIPHKLHEIFNEHLFFIMNYNYYY